MSHLLKILTFLIIISSNQSLKAENTYTYGIGLGVASYGGVGVNVGIVSPNDVKYLSFGAVSYGSYEGFNYILGLGWSRTDIIKTESNKHGLGIFAGIVDQELDVDEYSSIHGEQNVYGGGLTYNYYFNGIQNSGTKIGIAILYGNYEDDNEKPIIGSIEVGYQF